MNPKPLCAVNQINHTYPREGIIKTEIGNDGYYVLFEELSPLTQSPGNRYLAKTNFSGAKTMKLKEDSDYGLIDFTISGYFIFTLYSGNQGFLIKKFDLHGNLQNSKVLWENNSGSSYAINDRGRLVANNDMVSIAIRPEDYSTRLYSINADDLSIKWTKLIEPPQTISGKGMTGGSYDTFEQLAHPYMVFINIDKVGNTYVAVPALFSYSIYWHNQHFGESLSHLGGTFVSAGLETDALVTKVNESGERLYTIVAGSINPDECYGIKVINSSFYIYGRVGIPNNTFGYQWDAYVAKYNSSTGSREFFQSLDIDQSEIIYDLEETHSGDLIAVGSTGWSQNPLGYSVSEGARKMILLIDNNGNFKKEVSITSGRRHNQVRSIAQNNNIILIGGWENGPGTHTGDSDYSKVFADGFLQNLVSQLN